MKPSGLYIHVPFCKSKCIYCDFFSGGVSCADWNMLVDSLLDELRDRAEELLTVPDTLYIGGGTPSLMPGDCFRRLVDGVCEITGMSSHSLSEFTIEVNPEDVGYDNCRLWKECGVNRVSMGIQSLDDKELVAIGRRHNSDKAVKAFEILSQFFDNVTCDVMFGLPGQTLESWNHTLNGILKLGPSHISAYSLMFEDNTPLTVLRNKGALSFPDEDECVEMWSVLSRRLMQEGFRQYEISNYAIPGYESIHNRRYWLGNPYLGIGPSAHSYDGGRIRRSNPSDLKGYLKYFRPDMSESRLPFYKEEVLNDSELLEELVMLRMRMREGIDLMELENRFGIDAKDRLVENACNDLKTGCLKFDGNNLTLTRKGVMTADDIILRLIM